MQQSCTKKGQRLQTSVAWCNWLRWHGVFNIFIQINWLGPINGFWRSPVCIHTESLAIPIKSTVVPKVALHFGKSSTQVAEIVPSYQERFQDFASYQRMKKRRQNNSLLVTIIVLPKCPHHTFVPQFGAGSKPFSNHMLSPDGGFWWCRSCLHRAWRGLSNESRVEIAPGLFNYLKSYTYNIECPELATQKGTKTSDTIQRGLPAELVLHNCLIVWFELHVWSLVYISSNCYSIEFHCQRTMASFTSFMPFSFRPSWQ